MHHGRKLRIAYLSGPVDAEKVYQEWIRKKQEQFFGTVYLNQYFETCSEIGAEGYVISTLSGVHKVTRNGDFLFENRPIPEDMSGPFYHLAIGIWFLRIVPRLFRFRPDVLIVTALANYWFLLAILRLSGVLIVPALHCALWPKFRQLQLSWRILRFLNRFLVFNQVKSALAVSDDAAAQLRSLIGEKDVDIFVFNATYPRTQFSNLPRVSLTTAPPYRIFFAGRIEFNKGIFDLLEVAARLENARKGMFRFDICGDGSEMQTLRDRIEEKQLRDVFICYGWCAPSQYHSLLGQSHLVVIPTTTDFEEGFPKVFAEAILAGRPVITSAVCITKNVGSAAIEVPPNNVEAYYRAIIDICDNPALFEQKRQACLSLEAQFYDQNKSWGAQLRSVLRKHFGSQIATQP